MKERLKYIDIAKGILIFLVIIHHLPQLAIEYGISNDFLLLLDAFSNYYVAFFMPAFFIITGICTNFTKLSFGKFVQHQFATIMLPAFCLGAVSVWISLLAKGCTIPLEYCKIGFKTFIVSGGPFWFLTALFLAKIIFRIWLELLSKLKIVSGRLYIIYTTIFCLVLYIIGCICLKNNVFNVWRFEHALVLTIFLFVGQLLKRYNFKKLYLHSGVVYVISIFCFNIFGWKIPYVTARFNIDIEHIITFMILAVFGTMLVLYIAKRIMANMLIEYFGKNSLIVYTLHISVMYLVLNVGINVLGIAIVGSKYFTLLILCLIILLLKILAWLFNLKYFSFLQGKFNLKNKQ